MQMIDYLQIDNYKSIKRLKLKCSKINVFIGEPNVGKSNILEALDLSYLSWMLGTNEDRKKAHKQSIDIKKFFRINKVADLFNDGDISKTISILHPGFSVDVTQLKLHANNLRGTPGVENFFEVSTGNGSFTNFDNDFNTIQPKQYYGSPFNPYRFKSNIDFHDVGNYINKLMPPFGNNLLEVIKYNAEFRNFISDLIADFGLELNIDIADHKLFIQKKIQPGLVYSIKYEAIADTIRRIIFYVAAIRYNNAHIITLEEPDAHSFPKFVSFLADEIIQNKHNQFFIATHNPYLLNSLIENTPKDELGVFVCGFEQKNGTIARKLSQEDLSELLDYGVDIFFNINKYLDDRVEHNS